MNILVEVARELFGMFVADARLAAGVLLLVALVAWLLDYVALDPLACGGLLVVGSLVVVLEATLRQARNAKR